MPWLLVGTLLAAIGAGAIVYLAIRATYAFLRSFRKRRNTSIVAIDAANLAREIASNPNTYRKRLDALDDCEAVLVEYDPMTGSACQTSMVEQVDGNIRRDLNVGGGYVTYEG